jgi:CDGSH-type Zn-finger protein
MAIKGFVAGVLITISLLYGSSLLGGKSQSRVNNKVNVSSPKVVDTIDIEDMVSGDKKVLCRCWKSNSFPFCDGSHTKHNTECSDNIGPIIVKKA